VGERPTPDNDTNKGKDMKIVAFDTETYLIAPGRLAPKLVCASFATGASPTSQDRQLLAAPDAIKHFESLLADPEVTLVGHNVAYDIAVFVNAGVDHSLVWREYKAGRVLCTRIIQILRNIALGWTKGDHTGKRPKYSLSYLVEEHLNESIEGKYGEDVWRLRYHELDGLPVSEYPEAAYNYALLDAVYTWRVYNALMNPSAAMGGCADLDDVVPQCVADYALHLISAWGLRTDADAVDALEVSLRERVTTAMRKLQQAGIYRANGTKDLTRVRELVSASYGGQPPTTAKGAVSTATAILEECSNPDLRLLASISAEQKLLTTYVPLLRAGTKRPINARYSLVDSGRTSASKPNVQNQPRYGGVRECFVPRAGHVYVCADYHIAELCSLAQVLLNMYGSSRMAKALQEGRELHIETAAGILGIKYEEALERHKAGDKEVKRARQLAKAMNFGLPGGLGAESFVSFAKTTYGVEINANRAKQLKDLWLRRYPEMTRYFRDIGQQCNNGGGVYTLEQSVSKRKRGNVHFTSACNSHFQGLTADGAKAALTEVVRESFIEKDSALFGCRAVVFVHDEIIMECPEERAPEAAERLSTVMVEQMKRYCPNIPVKAEAHLMNRWYKNAEPVYRDGVLVLWEPGE